MTTVFLSTNPPFVSHAVPKDTVLLVFDSNLRGYKNAIAWLSKHPEAANVCRLVVPYSRNHADLGDYLVASSQEALAGDATKFPPGSTFSVSQVSRISSCSETWPFKSQSRLVDFQNAVSHLEDRILLRHPISGLSKLQEYMLCNKNQPENVLVAMCSAYFSIGMAHIKKQLAMLHQGNLPYMAHGNIDCLPMALLNGSFPVSVKDVCAMIRSYVDFRTFPLEGSIQPSAIGHTFVPCVMGGWEEAHTKDSNSNIVGLPYSVTKEEFAASNPGTDMSCAWKETFFSWKAKSLPVKVCWDPVFDGMTFNTPVSYMCYFMSQTLAIAIKNKWLDLRGQEEKCDMEREFMRKIFYGRRITDLDGSEIRYFVDECLRDKRSRIHEDFNGLEYLLDLPVRNLDADFINHKRVPNTPPSPSDLWIQMIDAYNDS